jgi:2'-5' RNA ligase
MRLFLGLEIPEKLKAQIHQYLLPMHESEKGWESPHDYHQTLLFIGEASPEDLLVIKDRMDRIEFKSFALRPNSFQFFNRRVMYLGFEKSYELLSLKNLIDQTFPEWKKVETKPFISHVTVKRWQRYEHFHLTSSLAKQEFRTESFRVDSIALFKSAKDTENNKYHVLYRKKLID